MDEQQIKQALQAVAQQEIPDDMNIWPQIKTMAQAQTPPQGKPILRLVKFAALVAIFMAVSAVTYAFYQQITNADPGIEAVDRDNKIIYFAQSKAIIPGIQINNKDYGLVVTLDYAYADANRITVAYTAHGRAPSSESIALYSTPTLLDDKGQAFSRMPLVGWSWGGISSASTEDSNASFEFSQKLTASFDASRIQNTPENINLQLKVDVAYGRSNVNEMIYAGDTTFDFSIPFNPGRSVTVGQTVTAGNVEMTLQKVVVSPSLTRLELCYDDPAPAGHSSTPYGQVEIGGKVIVPERGWTLSSKTGDTCRAVDTPAALQNESGEWKVMLTHLRIQGSENMQKVIETLKQQYNVEATLQSDGSLQYELPPDGQTSADFGVTVDKIIAENQQSVDGPWTFKFNLP